MVQAGEPEEEGAKPKLMTGDMVLDDYKVSALQKKKVKLQEELAFKTAPVELTPEQEKEKMNADIDALTKKAEE